ncbi:MAG: hypothetical protein RL033_398, partial [Pseudomonadota bacterium]
LVVVDLDRTSSRLLSLYMGPESYERFVQYRAPVQPVPDLPSLTG